MRTSKPLRVIRSTMALPYTALLGMPCERTIGGMAGAQQAAREAAESDEVDDLYLRATGDEQTDELLREIRKDERSHSLAVSDMRAEPSSRPAVAPAQARLDRILGREKWHEAGSGWMSGA